MNLSDMLTEPAVIAMPIKLIYNVQISVREKAGLVGVFGLCLVVIIFAIIRAKQILVETGFPNLILLEIWSTLECSIGKSSYAYSLISSDFQSLCNVQLIILSHSAVVVGCLPAFKSLIASRAATKRTAYGYYGSGNKSKVSGGGRLRSASIPLESFSNNIKSSNERRVSTSESQEEIVKSDPHSIMVKNDIVSTTVD
jgi:hypothetical protein